jgi:TM2 domain-containing membrane protein YozV
MAMSPYGPAGAVAVSPKNPALAVIASFFLPGLGQLINGDTNKGVAMLVTYVVSFLLMLVLIGFVTAFGVWVWSMVDAYQGARDWNLRHGILS